MMTKMMWEIYESYVIWIPHYLSALKLFLPYLKMSGVHNQHPTEVIILQLGGGVDSQSLKSPWPSALKGFLVKESSRGYLGNLDHDWPGHIPKKKGGQIFSDYFL